MSLSTKPYKGARDFYPEDKRVQRHIFDAMQTICERFGYEEYDAPILEPTELYLQKGNQEIIEQQTYSFTDRGKRDVTLRTEMTPSVSRMVAGRRQELAYPLRWYSIPQCWRYERTQRGRGREFYQLNVDLFGEAGLAAEHEMLLLIHALMRELQATQEMYTIKLNSRKLVQYLFDEVLGLREDAQQELSRLIDRMHKLEPADFQQQLSDLFDKSGVKDNERLQFNGFLHVTSVAELPDTFQSQESTVALVELMEMLQKSGIHNVAFDPTIMRGFDYYTDMVFEVMDTHPDNTRSMFGGGRYDGLVSSFGVEPVPTVGFGMGDITLMNFLEDHEILPEPATGTDVYAVALGDEVYDEALAVVSELRDAGINVAFDATNRKLEKSIKAADKKAIAYVLILGQKEIDSGRFTLKHLSSGEELPCDRSGLVDFLKHNQQTADES